MTIQRRECCGVTILQIEIYSSAESSPIVECVAKQPRIRREITSAYIIDHIIDQVFLQYSLCMPLVYLFGLKIITAELKFELGQHKNRNSLLRLLLRRRTVHDSYGLGSIVTKLHHSIGIRHDHDMAVSRKLPGTSHYSCSRFIVDTLIVSWLLGKLLSLSLILRYSSRLIA